MANAQNLCAISKVCETRCQWYCVGCLTSRVYVDHNKLAVAEVTVDTSDDPCAPHSHPMTLRLRRLWESDSNSTWYDYRDQVHDVYW